MEDRKESSDIYESTNGVHEMQENSQYPHEITMGSQGFVRGRTGFNPPRLVNGEGNAPSDKFRLKDVDYEKIVSYLEVPENFQAIHGGGRRTKVGGKYQSKAVVFKIMLTAMQHHGFPKDISGPNLTKRFQRYVKRYKEAREVKLQSGGGLTEEESQLGVNLEDKLNKLCPHFDRMHALYGERPNVNPSVVGDVGVEWNDLQLPVDSMDGDGEMQENVNPNTPDQNFSQQSQCTPTVILEDTSMLSPAQSVHDAAVIGPTPESLQHVVTDDGFWKDLDRIAEEHLQEGCGAQIGENHPIRSPLPNRPILSPIPSVNTIPGPTQPQIASDIFHVAPTATVKGAKTTTQAGKDSNSKPSFAAIYADRINLKADYRKEVIQSRDKWKCQDLAERREARLEARQREIAKDRLQRKHQLMLETVTQENALKRVRAEQDHALEMAKAACRTALLTTLFGSNKMPEEIKDLLPIVSQE